PLPAIIDVLSKLGSALVDTWVAPSKYQTVLAPVVWRQNNDSGPLSQNSFASLRISSAYSRGTQRWPINSPRRRFHLFRKLRGLPCSAMAVLSENRSCWLV